MMSVLSKKIYVTANIANYAKNLASFVDYFVYRNLTCIIKFQPQYQYCSALQYTLSVDVVLRMVVSEWLYLNGCMVRTAKGNNACQDLISVWLTKVAINLFNQTYSVPHIKRKPDFSS